MPHHQTGALLNWQEMQKILIEKGEKRSLIKQVPCMIGEKCKTFSLNKAKNAPSP